MEKAGGGFCRTSPGLIPCADVAEPVDAPDLESGGVLLLRGDTPCEFDPRHPHQAYIFNFFKVLAARQT